jgi:outer membrane immunogenic protein
MKSFLIATALALTLATSANAADLAARPYTKAPVVDPAYNWSGWYIGGNVGYSWGHSSTGTFLDPTSDWGFESVAFRNEFASQSSARYSPQGVVGGLQTGYNWQSGAWVFGLEADINGSDINKNVTYSTLNSGIIRTFTEGTKVDWFATFRPRVGYAVDRTLWYVTGGLAVGDVEGSWTVNSDNGYAKTGSTRSTKAGYTVGAGVEHAWMSNWTVKLEYLYTDLGSVSYNSVYVPGSTFAPPAFNYRESISQDIAFHTVRVGLNYKLNSPVFARY